MYRRIGDSDRYIRCAPVRQGLCMWVVVPSHLVLLPWKSAHRGELARESLTCVNIWLKHVKTIAGPRRPESRSTNELPGILSRVGKWRLARFVRVPSSLPFFCYLHRCFYSCAPITSVISQRGYPIIAE